MSSSKDDSQKNSKLPHRPEGVQKADEEHTGFLKYNNKSEKDPLIELFDTLQTVKDKTDQNSKEPDPIKSSNSSKNYSYESNRVFKNKWTSFLTGILVLGLGGWYWYQNGGNLPQLSKNKSEREPAAVTTAPEPPSPASSPSPVNQPQKPVPTNGNLGKRPDRKNLGTPTPRKTISRPSQKSGNGSGFFPSEDPSPTPQEEPRNTPEDEPEPPPPPPHEEPINTMDDLGSEEETYDQDDSDSDDNITTADGENPDQNDPQPKKRRRKQAAPQY